MANTDRANGFRVTQNYMGDNPAIAHSWPVAASQTIAKGDVVALDSAGRVIIATASTTANLGASAQVSASAAVDSEILVYDNPNQVFEAQISTGALTDPYTTRSSAACFDLIATTGGMYVNSAASSVDVFKVVGVGTEPGTGNKSAYGAYQKVLVKFNPSLHVFGTSA
jgi:hypothetical protein